MENIYCEPTAPSIFTGNKHARKLTFNEIILENFNIPSSFVSISSFVACQHFAHLVSSAEQTFVFASI